MESSKRFSSNLEDLRIFFDNRMTTLETKIDLLVNLFENFNTSTSSNQCCCESLRSKLENVEEKLESVPQVELVRATIKNNDSPPILLLTGSQSVNHDSVITLNSEKDYPDGSWLGDENDPKLRVRVKITPRELVHINETCKTPEKMAITLVDHLFPREVLAVSNLSGKGKHSKRQLDPLLIFGIKCHLIRHFNTDQKQWQKIKQNIDSKCRTVWRKRSRKNIMTNPALNTGSNLMLCEPISEESSDGYHFLDFGKPLKLTKHSTQLIQIKGEELVKGFTDEEELKEYLPTSSAELFSDNTFNLADNSIVVDNLATHKDELMLPDDDPEPMS